MITQDDESRKIYTVTVGRYNQLTTFEGSFSENNSFKYLDDDDGNYSGGNIGDLYKNTRMNH